MGRSIYFLLLLFFITSCSQTTKDGSHIADGKFIDAHLSLADSLAALPTLGIDSLTTIKVPSSLHDPSQFTEASKVIGSILFYF